MVRHGNQHVITFPQELYNLGSYVKKEVVDSLAKKTPKKSDKKMPMVKMPMKGGKMC